MPPTTGLVALSNTQWTTQLHDDAHLLILHSVMRKNKQNTKRKGWSGTACYCLVSGSGGSGSGSSRNSMELRSFSCCMDFLFLPFLPVSVWGSSEWDEPFPLLSCASHFRLDIVEYFKQTRKGHQVCCCLSFLWVPLFLCVPLFGDGGSRNQKLKPVETINRKRGREGGREEGKESDPLTLPP